MMGGVVKVNSEREGKKSDRGEKRTLGNLLCSGQERKSVDNTSPASKKRIDTKDGRDERRTKWKGVPGGRGGDINWGYFAPLKGGKGQWSRSRAGKPERVRKFLGQRGFKHSSKTGGEKKGDGMGKNH